MEGAVIAAFIIIAGVGLIILGLLSLRDFNGQRNEFAPIETDGLHPLWGKVFKLHRLHGYLDLIIYFTLGPLSIAFGLYALLK